MRQRTESLQEVPKTVNGGLGHNRPSHQPLASLSEKKGEKPQKQKAHPDQDSEFDCDTHPPLLIPDGKYQGSFIWAEKGRLWNQEKIYLWFKIVDFGDLQGEELYMACNAPKKSKNGKAATSAKYYQSWVLAAGRKPDRYDRMSTKVFRGKVFLLKVRTVIKNAKNLPLPPLLQYSVIDDVLEKLTNSEKI